MRWLKLSLSLLVHTAAAAPRSLEGTLKTGDLVFHTSRSRQSAATQAATDSPLSHVGLVEVTPEGVFVVEAVQPVKRVPFAQWKARGVNGRLLVLRPERLGTLNVKRLEPALRERYSGEVPLDLELITPASLAEDERLTVVHSDFPRIRS